MLVLCIQSAKYAQVVLYTVYESFYCKLQTLKYLKWGWKSSSFSRLFCDDLSFSTRQLNGRLHWVFSWFSTNEWRNTLLVVRVWRFCLLRSNKLFRQWRKPWVADFFWFPTDEYSSWGRSNRANWQSFARRCQQGWNKLLYKFQRWIYVMCFS